MKIEQHAARVAAEHETPIWIYDADVIRKQARALASFDTVRFAQKALSNLSVLRLVKQEGVKLDAVSLGEIERAIRAGFDPKSNCSGASGWSVHRMYRRICLRLPAYSKSKAVN